MLFLERKHFQLACCAVEALPRTLLDGLRPTVPLFTKALCRGIATAEDPTTGESFGQHCCRLVAESLLRASTSGRRDTQMRLDAIGKRFAAEGIRLDRPHLNANSVDYEPPVHVSLGSIGAKCLSQNSTKQRQTLWLRRPVIENSPERFLEAAAQIGCRIVRDAIWAGDRCNWIAAHRDPNSPHFQQMRAAYGPGLLSGTAGIGLFLSRLFTKTAEPLYRATALGALRHAIAGIEDLDESLRLDFYHGPIGVAFAADRAAIDLECDELSRHAGQIRRSALEGVNEPTSLPPLRCDGLPAAIDTAEETYNLIAGQAGLGYFYLRLYDPSLDSPVLTG